MLERLRKFIHRLRESDEDTKTFWLWIFSGGTMIVVISFWVVYINYSIVGVADRQLDESVIAAEVSGFWPVFKNGLTIVAGQLGSFGKRLSRDAQNQISALIYSTRSIIIDSAQPNFIPEDLKAVPYQKLP